DPPGGEQVAIQVARPLLVGDVLVVRRYGEAEAAARTRSEYSPRLVEAGDTEAGGPLRVADRLGGESRSQRPPPRRALPGSGAAGPLARDGPRLRRLQDGRRRRRATHGHRRVHRNGRLRGARADPWSGARRRSRGPLRVRRPRLRDAEREAPPRRTEPDGHSG